METILENSKVREDAVRQLLNGIGNVFPYEQVFNGLDAQGWTIHPLFFKDKVIGAIIEKDGSIHTSISPEYQKKWNPRPYVKKFFIRLYSDIKSYTLIQKKMTLGL